MENISKFKDIHKGEDIYVIGSGSSCDYISKDFFDSKVSVGTNQTYRKYDTTYIVRKEHSLLHKTLNESSSIVLVARRDCGSGKPLNTTQNINRLYYYDHLTNVSKINLDAFNIKDYLVVSDSTITSSMHFAYHLGAKNIILVGVDHGLLDGKYVFEGYYDSIKETPWKVWDEYKNWLKKLERDTVVLKDKINSLGVNVYSLNPFINFKLEGHVYKG